MKDTAQVATVNNNSANGEHHSDLASASSSLEESFRESGKLTVQCVLLFFVCLYIAVRVSFV